MRSLHAITAGVISVLLLTCQAGVSGQDWQSVSSPAYSFGDTGSVALLPSTTNVYGIPSGLGPNCQMTNWQGAACSAPLQPSCAAECSRTCGGFRNRISSGLDTCPPQSFALPLGMLVNSALCQQVLNGKRAQMVFYQYDFAFFESTQSWELSALGYRHLGKIAQLSQKTDGPIIIEQSSDPLVDMQRQQKVVDMLMSQGALASPERVVIGRSPVAGISGEEAQLIYGRSLEPNQLKGSGETGFGFIPGSGSAPDSNAAGNY